MTIELTHRPTATKAADRTPFAPRPVGVDRRPVKHALDLERRLQLALGLIWLTDGALQLQPFMFTRSFVTHIIATNTTDQPRFVAWPIKLSEHLIEPHPALFNTVAASVQILIALGLFYRPTVKLALLNSLAWALGVWWVGEGLGSLLTEAGSPLTGAPGAALLYILAALMAWPRTSTGTKRHPTGGVLGTRGARLAWSTLWLGSAALWLLPANRTANAIHNQITHAPSGANWLSSIQANVATTAEGHGAIIAIAAASLSAAVALAALLHRWQALSLTVTATLALIYFVIGQGMGGILTGTGTDPGTGPLLIWLALAIHASSACPTLRLTRTHRDKGQMLGNVT